MLGNLEWRTRHRISIAWVRSF
uniref:Uncharacterized protein n=1 Tax=Rhizophora mucronata TaxID=61149 RepID=A0A2P2PVX1_RHIMU